MQHLRWPNYPIGDFTELGVHGAGATPIERVLDSAENIQVAGDETAGFYRAIRNKTANLVGDPRKRSQRGLPEPGTRLRRPSKPIRGAASQLAAGGGPCGCSYYRTRSSTSPAGWCPGTEHDGAPW